MLYYIELRATCLAIFSYFDHMKGIVELKFLTHVCTITNQTENFSQSNTISKYYNLLLHNYRILNINKN